MTEDEALKIYTRIFILRNLVNYHSDLYYLNDSPVLSDVEFDKLYSKLEALEKQHPWSLIESSPTQVVGGRANRGFKKIKHLAPMYSLDKIHTEQDFHEWDARMQKLLSE